jgi:hypothetical protein
MKRAPQMEDLSVHSVYDQVRVAEWNHYDDYLKHVHRYQRSVSLAVAGYDGDEVRVGWTSDCKSTGGNQSTVNC